MVNNGLQLKVPHVPIKPGSVRRILIIRRWMIGDVLMTTPVVRTVRKYYPRAHITFLTGQTESEILLHNPDIDEILVETPKVCREIERAPACDLAINLELGNIYSDTCCLLSRAKFRIGRWRQSFPDPIRVYNVFPEFAWGRTIIEDRLKVTKALGLRHATKKTRIYLTDGEKRFAKDYLKEFKRGGKRCIGIHPGGHTDVTRPFLWGARRFAKLADRLANDFRATVLIFQGPQEEAIARDMYRQVKRKEDIFMVPVFPLRTYASLIHECGFLVSHDRGPLHIAAALNAKTVSIFTMPWAAPFWFPYEEKDGHCYLQKKRVQEITVEEVARAAAKLLRGA